MLEKIKKHSVKIFVFTINILLAAIAVLIIREKDQARLLENAQKENPTDESAQNIPPPSFESSVSSEILGGDSSQTNVSEPSPPDNSAMTPAAPVPDPTVSDPANSTSNTIVPAPTTTTKPSNAKTKTS